MKSVLALSAGALVVVAGCSTSSTESTSSPEPTTASASAPVATTGTSTSMATPPVSQPGAYIDYAEYQANKAQYDGENVVLFFNASWCPTCQEAVKNFQSETIPNDLVIVSVDYDSNQDLRRKYGVTYQHTFVEINPSGEELKKFSGSTTAGQVEQEIAS